VTRPAIEVRHLTRVFQGRRKSSPSVTALSSFNLTVSRGSLVALTGPNGAGKTTLIEILATLLLPTSGDVKVDGLDVVRDDAAVRARIAHCPAGVSSFFPRLTGRENLAFFSSMSGVPRADMPRRLAGAAERVGLAAAVLDREVRTYSDGLAQRLNLARAVMREAGVWLLDEPTRSLDPESRAATWALVREVAASREVTVLAATHDIDGARAHADEVVRLA
jgi:ABC-2 type transport system ATP-binding protein